MPGRTTGFQDGPRMKAFRALEAILRADPALAREVKTWSSWRGEGNDAMPTSPAMCPFLQLSPVVFPNETMAQGVRIAVLGVRVRIAVSGLYAEDVVDFWDAVEDALTIGSPFQDTTVYCHLQKYRVFQVKVQAPAIDAWRSRDTPPNPFLEGAGLVTLRISRTA